MNTRILAAAWLVASLSIPLRAEVDVAVSADIRIGKMPPPPPPEVVIITEVPPGPPPWAPAHGFRRNRGYYYYPGYDVYYRPVDHVWFYIEGGNWRSGPSLPPNVRVDFHRAVPLTMETDRPFEFHEKVRTYYPQNYFVTQVRVKDDRGNDDFKKPGHEDHNDQGSSNPGHKDKGKGKGKPKDK